ncbi:hypothetical protein CLAIMM_14105 isoform 1 [Cladophialophora immunda]|nr:hypothetical protein CLAIMM_14105 isoform 1 [Cladophialophora immunda]
MRKLAVSVGQTLLLMTLFALLIFQELHKQPLIDKLHDSLRFATNGLNRTRTAFSTLSEPVQPSTSSLSSKLPSATATLIQAEAQDPGEDDRQTPAPLATPIEVQAPQVLRVDCKDRETDRDSFNKARDYVHSIMNGSDGDVPQLECPPLNPSRYLSLHDPTASAQKRRFFFAMNLHQSAHIIPQLLGAIIEVVRFLGPKACVISVVEGRSTDGTFEILKSLAKEMEHLGVSYFLSCNELQPGGEGMERISTLAELRNRALWPLTQHAQSYDPSTTIIFLNDIAPCAEDILELIYQRALLKADMTCGMDWYNLDDGGTFYDSWIGRQMNGETFFEVPQSTSWDFSKNLFWNHETSKSRYSLGQPLQVFSCWNGAVALTAKPFLEAKIWFRTEVEEECHLGEPVHLAKDLWKLGHGKIAVIPSVNVGYSVDDSRRAKEAHGSVTSVASKESVELSKINWQQKPPGKLQTQANGFPRHSIVQWENSRPEKKAGRQARAPQLMNKMAACIFCKIIKGENQWRLRFFRAVAVATVENDELVCSSSGEGVLTVWVSAGEIPSFKLFESDKVLAFLDIQPLSRGHAVRTHAPSPLIPSASPILSLSGFPCTHARMNMKAITPQDRITQTAI